MSKVDGSPEKLWSYRFNEPGGSVVATDQCSGDDAAEARARELSKSSDAPIIVERHSGHIDAWEYVTEVDARS